MTLEQNIVALTAEVTKMLGKVDESRTEALRAVSRLAKSLPYEYVVSTNLPISTEEEDSLGGIRTAQTISGIMAKIANDRASSSGEAPQGLDILTSPFPVTVTVHSFNDSLPVTIDQPNVEMLWSKSVVFKIPAGGNGVVVTARDVTLTGGTYAFPSPAAGNYSIKSTAGTRTDVRAARLINHDESGLDGVDGKALDITPLDL